MLVGYTSRYVLIGNTLGMCVVFGVGYKVIMHSPLHLK